MNRATLKVAVLSYERYANQNYFLVDTHDKKVYEGIFVKAGFDDDFFYFLFEHKTDEFMLTSVPGSPLWKLYPYDSLEATWYKI